MNKVEDIKIVLLIVSDKVNYFNPSLKILSNLYGKIMIIGATGQKKLNVVYDQNELEYISPSEINGICDYILVVGAKDYGVKVIRDYCQTVSIDTNKLIYDWIACIPGFTLEKYKLLVESQLSIFSKHCFGGIVSHLLGLNFRSPFVNLFLSDEDFIRFLKFPRDYIDKQPVYIGTEWEKNLKFDYPVCSMDSLKIHFNHYHDAEQAINKWNERKTRINWYNLLVVTSTDDEKILEEFDKLPYGKKVCFTSFESELSSAFYLDENKSHYGLNQSIGEYSLEQARWPFIYDIFDMLLYGKKTLLIKQDKI